MTHIWTLINIRFETARIPPSVQFGEKRIKVYSLQTTAATSLTSKLHGQRSSVACPSVCVSVCLRVCVRPHTVWSCLLLLIDTRHASVHISNALSLSRALWDDINVDLGVALTLTLRSRMTQLPLWTSCFTNHIVLKEVQLYFLL